MATKEQKRIYGIGMKAYRLFNDLRDLCYSEDIAEFDRLHDDLYWQAQGIVESLHECRADIKEGCDISGFESEFKEALVLAKSIERYRKTLLKLSTKDFNWIYG